MFCQKILSTFYTPPSLLNQSTIRTFRHPVSRYARRFFLMLVSHGTLEKAYRMAIDLNSSDLFVDLYNSALEKNQLTLAYLCAERTKPSKTLDHLKAISQYAENDIIKRQLDEISESDDNRQEQTKCEPLRFDRFGKSEPRFKAYTEKDVEGFSRDILVNNIFLSKLKIDGF